MKRRAFVIIVITILLLSSCLTLDEVTIQEEGGLDVRVEDRLCTEEKRDSDDLVAQWHMDEGSGTYIGDGSGNDNHGTLNVGGGDDAESKWVDGVRGNALEFDGENDYVDTGVWQRPEDITIEAWIKTDSIR